MANEQTGLEHIANYLDKMEKQIQTKLRDETTDKDDRISLRGALVMLREIKGVVESEAEAERNWMGENRSH